MSRAATKAEEIAEHMMLGKATVDKLEVIEDVDERMEDVENITNPRMAVMLVMYVNTFRV